MRKWTLITIVLVLVVVACDREEKLSISDEALIAVMVDVHVVDGLLDRHKGPVRDSLKTLYMDQLFHIHQINEAALNQYTSYLKRHPEKAKEIYTAVQDTISARITNKK